MHHEKSVKTQTMKSFQLKSSMNTTSKGCQGMQITGYIQHATRSVNLSTLFSYLYTSSLPFVGVASIQSLSTHRNRKINRLISKFSALQNLVMMPLFAINISMFNMLMKNWIIKLFFVKGVILVSGLIKSGATAPFTIFLHAVAIFAKKRENTDVLYYYQTWINIIKWSVCL